MLNSHGTITVNCCVDIVRELGCSTYRTILYQPCIASISHLQWSYGVTCWELFTGGKIPYPGVDPISLSSLLESGHRLDKPNNAACSEEMLVVLATTHFSKREEV